MVIFSGCLRPMAKRAPVGSSQNDVKIPAIGRSRGQSRARRRVRLSGLAKLGERAHISMMAGTLLRRFVSAALILTFAVSVMAGHLAMAGAAPSMGPSHLCAASDVDRPGQCDHGPAKAMVTADCKAMCGLQTAIVPASTAIDSRIVSRVWGLTGAVQLVPGIKPALAPPQS